MTPAPSWTLGEVSMQPKNIIGPIISRRTSVWGPHQSEPETNCQKDPKTGSPQNQKRFKHIGILLGQIDEFPWLRKKQVYQGSNPMLLSFTFHNQKRTPVDICEIHVAPRPPEVPTNGWVLAACASAPTGQPSTRSKTVPMAVPSFGLREIFSGAYLSFTFSFCLFLFWDCFNGIASGANLFGLPMKLVPIWERSIVLGPMDQQKS